MTVVFTNYSGMVNGDVDLTGQDRVTIAGGTVIGNVDMSGSTSNTFTMSGGAITGEVIFGGGDGTITKSAGAGTAFDLLANATNTDFVYDFANASYGTGTTAATRDSITGWVDGGAKGDILDLQGFLKSAPPFSSIGQDLIPVTGAATYDDIITVAGSKFSVEVMGVATALSSASFKL